MHLVQKENIFKKEKFAWANKLTKIRAVSLQSLRGNNRPRHSCVLGVWPAWPYQSEELQAAWWSGKRPGVYVESTALTPAR